MTASRSEPKFLRIERRSQQRGAWVPSCDRCGKLLPRLRKRWCSQACINVGSYWADQLNKYWPAP